VVPLAGHFVRIRIRSNFSTIFRLLLSGFGNIYCKVFARENKRIGAILDEKWFLRTNSSVALAIFVEELSSDECLVDLVSYAGGVGLLNISWDSHLDYIADVLRFLKSHNIEFKKEMEINYLYPTNWPDDVKRMLAELG